MKSFDDPFPSYLAKQADIDAAWEHCEQRFASFTPPLDALATRFLRSVAGSSNTHRTYFSNPFAPPLLYMPLWLSDGLDLGPSVHAQVVRIVAGTMQGYIYVRIQDDVLDEPDRSDPNLMLFGNACFSGMVASYAEALGSRASGFWPAFDRAIIDFSRLTLAEQQVVRQDEPYAIERFDELADKVAFARIPMLAVAALAGRFDLEPSVRTLVHQLGIAYGIVNDVIGWPRDLRAGHRTYVLALAGLTRADVDRVASVADEVARDAAREMLAEKLREKLYEGRVLHDALTRAADMHVAAEASARALGLVRFDDFHADRTAWISALDRQVSTMTLTRLLEAARAKS